MGWPRRDGFAKVNLEKEQNEYNQTECAWGIQSKRDNRGRALHPGDGSGSTQHAACAKHVVQSVLYLAGIGLSGLSIFFKGVKNDIHS